MTLKLMKGHTFRDHGHKMEYPALAQVKYDEIRCDIRIEFGRVVFRSFANKTLFNLEKFDQALAILMDLFDVTRLDTGVMVNNSYGDTYRYVRSKSGVPCDLSSADVNFILFDLPYDPRDFCARLGILKVIADSALSLPGFPHIMVPQEYMVTSPEDVERVYTDALALGHEGLMLKKLTGKYQLGKRTYDWLKVKPEETVDGVIRGINRGTSMDGEPLDRATSVTVEMEDGSTADVAGIPHDLGRALLTNPNAFIGEWAEIVYMMRDRQGGYRHPRFKRLREAKE